MSLFGHETDPVEDACMEHRAATCGDGHWSDMPCVCAVLRMGREIGYQEGVSAGIAVERKAWLDGGHWKLAPHLCRSATPRLHIGEPAE